MMLPIALGVVIKDNHILLIKRTKPPFQGMYGLPGGKIEKDEHVSEAAVREILEEAGIPSAFDGHLGFVSEHVHEEDSMHHALIHVCSLLPKHTDQVQGEEGSLHWFALDDLPEEKIIPSDHLMIERFVKTQEKTYYDCIIRKKGEEYLLEKFD